MATGATVTERIVKLFRSVPLIALLLLARSTAAQTPPLIANLGTCPLERGGAILDCRIAYRTLRLVSTL